MSDTKIKDSYKKIIVSLDYDELKDAKTTLEQLKGTEVCVKFGNQLGTYAGWKNTTKLARHYGLRVFCDTKFKDIPNTVEKSARSITRFEPDFFNIMADNSIEALRAAVRGRDEAVKDYNLKTKPVILGVTVLTSMSDEESIEIYGDKAEAKVLQFAKASAIAGLDGLVCSAQEAKVLKSNPDTRHLLLVTPGIRPYGSKSSDQARAVTPLQAIKNGADYLVIGRPITKAPDQLTPREALNKIINELNSEA
jgi:orotidine-5'-phosphate decarboxylase